MDTLAREQRIPESSIFRHFVSENHAIKQKQHISYIDRLVSSTSSPNRFFSLLLLIPFLNLFAMKPLPWLASALLLGASFAQAQTNPFYPSQSQKIMSPYAKTGKMEQIGTTGVAAMHAVLVRYTKL